MKTRQPDYNYTFTNKADLIEEIIYQKRVEFWGEGLEYIDNRRLNIPVDRTDETWGAENNNHFSAGKFRYNQEEQPVPLSITSLGNREQFSAFSDRSELTPQRTCHKKSVKVVCLYRFFYMNQQKNDTEVLSLSFKCSFIFLSKELSAQTN